MTVDAMIEAITCIFLISFPLAIWALARLGRKIYQHRARSGQSNEGSFLAKILSDPVAPAAPARRPDPSTRAEGQGTV
jgi:hypothetical protein